MYELIVSGMTCMHCVGAVTEALKNLDPQAQVKVDLSAQSVQVWTKTGLDAVVTALDDAGFPVQSKSALV